ncbi:MAG: gliding motility-associated ABC transporter substrate-binding protein GldG [Paludibacteraceae bacterium]|nr:gliding motility-associated ABC transporter substrate-binding protein GldG [Paludibacteraceae bacterium]
MKLRTAILLIAGIVAVNIPLQWLTIRQDLTSDKRYTLSEATKTQFKDLNGTLKIDLMLDGELNSGFTRLRKATDEIIRELSLYADIKTQILTQEQAASLGLSPTIIHERTQDGRTAQTTIYPYARLKYNGKSMIVNLLQNNRGLSGEENLNRSIEGLEYTLAEAIHTIKQTEVARVAFLEGHGETEEQNVYDLEQALSRYFQIDRGVLGNQAGILDQYKCVIIADPQQPFSETDKYILDQYVMQGGRILWLLNGVRFSGDMLQTEGVTPIIALDLNLTDMLFRYGVRINPALVQDLQCLPIPVDVSQDPSQPNFQPLPWTYAPLLLTNENSPITRGVMQVMSTMVSCVEWVGGEDGLSKDILLATSTASMLTPTPAEVDLSDLTINRERFQYAYIPVATSLEGIFPSVFAHRMPPEGIINPGDQLKTGKKTRQIVVAGGNLAKNDWEQGQPLPVGFDRYTETQFGNRDFLVNSVLWLTDDAGLISLRQKTVALRLLNDKIAHDQRKKIQIISLLTPLVLIALPGAVVGLGRRKKYKK